MKKIVYKQTLTYEVRMTKEDFDKVMKAEKDPLDKNDLERFVGEHSEDVEEISWGDVEILDSWNCE